MKIAYLILCHKNPNQVQILIDKLNSRNTDFYIHIDKKSKEFDLNKKNNIFILPPERRIDVRWATSSMVSATMELIHFMLEHNKVYDYIFLISGQDFPIKTNEEIEKYLTDNLGFNFIEVLPHTHKLYKRYKKRNELYYPRWMQKSSVCAKVLKKLYILLSGGYMHTFVIFKRTNIENITFEFGSQWWCLTYECLLWIANYIDNNQKILKFFENSLTPDECIFQTAFMQSPYKENIHNNITYLEWAENKNNPRVFTAEDYCLLKSSDCLFARKFDIEADKEIIKLLK